MNRASKGGLSPLKRNQIEKKNYPATPVPDGDV